MSASYFLLAGVALQESVVSSLRCLPIFMVAQILMSTDLGNVSLLPSPPLLVYSDVGGDVGRRWRRQRVKYRACAHDSCCYRILAVTGVSFVSFAIIRSITSDLTHR